MMAYNPGDKNGISHADKQTSAFEDIDLKIACTSVNSTQDSLPETKPRATRERVRTWGNDSIQEGEKPPQWDWRSPPRWKLRWTWFLHDTYLHTWHALQRIFSTTKSAPLWKHMHWSRKHFYAFSLVIIGAVIPITTITTSTPLSSLFTAKTLSCGDNFSGQPQNATVTGIEQLFALDATWGRFTFSQTKTIDILRDSVVGKGVQALAWWASYRVFGDALLRAIERHPASFAIFQRIAMEGPSLLSLWTLMKELRGAKSARTRALFGYVFLSTTYVLLVPIVLGAMTGYDSTSISWVDLQEENNIIPASQLERAWLITGTKNETWKQAACADSTLRASYGYITSERRQNCNCQYPNTTRLTPTEQEHISISASYSAYEVMLATCTYNFPNNTQTWTERYPGPFSPDEPQTYACNTSVLVPVNGKTYDADDVDTQNGYCYNNVGYNYTYLEGRSRCLPDTANPRYQWGFATMMSGLFVVVTSVWTASMWVLWLDAQFYSQLVRGGYRVAPVRAAFAMAVAAARRTGWSGRELVRGDMPQLEGMLYGGKGVRGAVVGVGVFVGCVEDEAGEGEGGDEMNGSGSPSSPDSSKERGWLPSLSRDNDTEIRARVGSDMNLSVHVLGDEELSKRYLRGVQEARVVRKPLTRESTCMEDATVVRKPLTRESTYVEQADDDDAENMDKILRGSTLRKSRKPG